MIKNPHHHHHHYCYYYSVKIWSSLPFTSPSLQFSPQIHPENKQTGKSKKQNQTKMLLSVNVRRKGKGRDYR